MWICKTTDLPFFLVGSYPRKHPQISLIGRNLKHSSFKIWEFASPSFVFPSLNLLFVPVGDYNLGIAVNVFRKKALQG